MRILKPGGFLVITDFDVKKDLEVAYTHDHRLKVFKRNIVNLFSNLESLILIGKKALVKTVITLSLMKIYVFQLQFTVKSKLLLP